MSLLQAFSLGVPAIVTAVGGMAEAVQLAQAGVIVSATDPAAMCAAILRLAENTSERAQYSQNAIDAFQRHFSLRAMVDAYASLYQKTRRYRRRMAAL